VIEFLVRADDKEQNRDCAMPDNTIKNYHPFRYLQDGGAFDEKVESGVQNKSLTGSQENPPNVVDEHIWNISNDVKIADQPTRRIRQHAKRGHGEAP
jgi:hypothetical protein